MLILKKACANRNAVGIIVEKLIEFADKGTEKYSIAVNSYKKNPADNQHAFLLNIMLIIGQIL